MRFQVIKNTYTRTNQIIFCKLQYFKHFNMSINIFSLHYFLWFAALTPIYGYIGVYAEHYANTSTSQYGLLSMILTFVTIVAKLFFCSLADRHRAYRSFFIYFLITSLVGFGSFGALPFFIKPQSKVLGLNYSAWILICSMTSVAIISMGVISCLSDAFAMNSSIKNNSSYGHIRLWGTLGWGAGSVLIIFISQTDKLPLLVPGLIVTIVFIFIDTLVAIFWPHTEDFNLDKSASNIGLENVASVLAKDTSNNVVELTDASCKRSQRNNYGTTETKSVDLFSNHDEQQNEDSNINIQWLLFKEVATKRKSIFRYMTLFTISGALISLQWNYFFLYLKDVYAADFTFITGLSMVGQSMLGELPFFILSKIIIQKLGRSHTLSLSLISLGFRYLLYEFLLPNSSMYFVLLTEPLQGPSFGLFYVVMAEVGLDYSDCEDIIVEVVEKGLIDNNPDKILKLRMALRATMQSLMSACYEGLGLGIGSIVGGLVIDYYGFSQLWLWSAIVAIVFGFTNLMIEVFNLPLIVEDNLNSVSKTN